MGRRWFILVMLGVRPELLRFVFGTFLGDFGKTIQWKHFRRPAVSLSLGYELWDAEQCFVDAALAFHLPAQ